MTTLAAVISDSHLHRAEPWFRDFCHRILAPCEVVIHAGDLVSGEILALFSGKRTYAVHGNMCDAATRRTLARAQAFTIEQVAFGLCHGAHLGPDIEAAMQRRFPGARCLVYGHTHRPTVHRRGDTLFLNPGALRPASRGRAGGTYLLLEIDGDRVRPTLHRLQDGG